MDERQAIARRCAAGLIVQTIGREWSEYRRGQGVSHLVDLGIGGPSEYYTRGDFATAHSPHGPDLLALADGHYLDHPVRARHDDAQLVLRRANGEPVEAPGFPVEIPLLAAPASFAGDGVCVDLAQAHLLIFSLRRHYWKNGAENAGAEHAGRDDFIDFADIGLRFDTTEREGRIPAAFAAWLERLIRDP